MEWFAEDGSEWEYGLRQEHRDQLASTAVAAAAGFVGVEAVVAETGHPIPSLTGAEPGLERLVAAGGGAGAGAAVAEAVAWTS
eukprot:m.237886 g.237886  ORF g.237886 m.237886 type:complete len:83 (-) comp10912_c1_seq1:94-342(-)